MLSSNVERVKATFSEINKGKKYNCFYLFNNRNLISNHLLKFMIVKFYFKITKQQGTKNNAWNSKPNDDLF